MKFSDFNLNEDLLKGIEETGYLECMPVQEQTYQLTLQGRDVAVQSQTGSGKTAAFIVSIFQLLISDERRRKAIVIVPTRELAVQIEEEARSIGRHLPFSIASFFGGMGFKEQEDALKRGVQLIIGTPGRLLDLARSKKLNFKEIDILVIDEADRLFDMGFFPDIRQMIKKMPPYEERHTMLFSATLSMRVMGLAYGYMNDPQEIALTPEQVTVDTISQKLYHVSRNEKVNLLLGILKKENPRNGLIFTNMKHTAIEVSRRLEVNGFHCQFIIGDLPQKKRLKVIEDFKSGKVPFLIATDVAARGLHIDDLELVVNYDLPNYSENYVHRIGRTARAGKTGLAVSLVCEDYVHGLEAIEKFIDMKIDVDFADDDMFMDDMSRGMSFSKDISEVMGDRRGGGDRDRRGGRGERGSSGRSSRDGRGERGPRRDRSDRSDRPDRPAERPATDRPAAAARPAERHHADRPERPAAPPREPRERKVAVAAEQASQDPSSSASKRPPRKRGPRKGKQQGEGYVPRQEQIPAAAASNAGAGRQPKPAREMRGGKAKPGIIARLRTKIGKKNDLQKRLAYYSEKYGDNYTISYQDLDPRGAKRRSFGTFIVDFFKQFKGKK